MYDGQATAGLNRTFYGIETFSLRSAHGAAARLNRTFYGIETRQRVDGTG